MTRIRWYGIQDDEKKFDGGPWRSRGRRRDSGLSPSGCEGRRRKCGGGDGAGSGSGGEPWCPRGGGGPIRPLGGTPRSARPRRRAPTRQAPPPPPLPLPLLHLRRRRVLPLSSFLPCHCDRSCSSTTIRRCPAQPRAGRWKLARLGFIGAERDLGPNRNKTFRPKAQRGPTEIENLT